MNAILEIPGIAEIREELAEIRATLARLEAPQAEELLTVREVARRLNVTDQTVRKWGNDGSLRVHSRIGRKMMFHPDDIQSSRDAKSSGEAA